MVLCRRCFCSVCGYIMMTARGRHALYERQSYRPKHKPQLQKQTTKRHFFCSVFNGNNRETVVGLTNSILSICFKIKLTHIYIHHPGPERTTQSIKPCWRFTKDTLRIFVFYCLHSYSSPALCIYLLKLDVGVVKRREDKDLLFESYQHRFRHLRCRIDTEGCFVYTTRKWLSQNRHNTQSAIFVKRESCVHLDQFLLIEIFVVGLSAKNKSISYLLYH